VSLVPGQAHRLYAKRSTVNSEKPVFVVYGQIKSLRFAVLGD
jgi:hypothetical protein